MFIGYTLNLIIFIKNNYNNKMVLKNKLKFLTVVVVVVLYLFLTF